jgi:hypothetical protein
MTFGIEFETNCAYCLALHSKYASDSLEVNDTSLVVAVVQTVTKVSKMLGGQFQMTNYLG